MLPKAFEYNWGYFHLQYYLQVLCQQKEGNTINNMTNVQAFRTSQQILITAIIDYTITDSKNYRLQESKTKLTDGCGQNHLLNKVAIVKVINSRQR